jgi:hypothetical protein
VFVEVEDRSHDGEIATATAATATDEREDVDAVDW